MESETMLKAMERIKRARHVIYCGRMGEEDSLGRTRQRHQGWVNGIRVEDFDAVIAPMLTRTEPSTITEEGAARTVHEAMYWAAEQKGRPQLWQNGNSLAEVKARDVARTILAASGHTALLSQIERLTGALVGIAELQAVGKNAEHLGDIARAALSRPLP